MNSSLLDITKWLNGFKPPKSDKVTLIIAPSAPYLGILKDVTNKNSFQLAGQDVSVSEKGAHTGEIGAFQLKDFANYCIIGHSERKEPRELVTQKTHTCINEGITPILCFVNQDELTSGEVSVGTFLVWEDPNNISVNGTYREKNPEEIVRGIDDIRNKIAPDAVLLYGGSVNRQNAGLLAKIDKLDGILVGNASLDPTHFSEIISAFS